MTTRLNGITNKFGSALTYMSSLLQYTISSSSPRAGYIALYKARRLISLTGQVHDELEVPQKTSLIILENNGSIYWGKSGHVQRSTHCWHIDDRDHLSTLMTPAVTIRLEKVAAVDIKMISHKIVKCRWILISSGDRDYILLNR